MASGIIKDLFTTNSYIKLPGIAICWGKADSSTLAYNEFSFPVKFKELPTFVCCPYYYTGHNALTYHVYSSFTGSVAANNLKACIYFRKFDGSAFNDANGSSFWIAIGKI